MCSEKYTVKEILECDDELHMEWPFADSRMLRGLGIDRANQVWAPI